MLDFEGLTRAVAESLPDIDHGFHTMNRPLSHSLSQTISAAIEVFVAGFCETKSRTWPYESIRTEDVWTLRDVERKNAKVYRKEEWIAFNVAAERVHSLAQQGTRGRYFVCAIIGSGDSPEQLKASYKELGYRLLSTEPMFVHSLQKIPTCLANVKISLLRKPDQAESYAIASRMRPEPPERIVDPSYRQYLACHDDEIVGWVRSVETPRGNYCTNMVVKPAWRRLGIAHALLAQMLRDDRKRGAAQNVLLSSHTGALVYPQLGYQQIGTLFIFAPKKR